ncbi:uncharacterized protein BCR38DRAFT_455048 [Pseudomassariella vexata]|uniref:Protein kinase domain-containing protein n=1 Tax=Pseudomassariella vexata TaxID=1141098 RepID=A0A1Y2EFX8_9PEZI|nr:uncharacterized protein BCR38DRAFT_455048 [Pseudomassariella vexata]ORY70214.1 hypothetical protein BCR38DRAFT_455048 [Pseudomassariella vexata]
MEVSKKRVRLATARRRVLTRIRLYFRLSVKRQSALVLMLVAAYLVFVHHEYREALRDKYRPTAFSSDVLRNSTAQWKFASKDHSQDPDHLWENRAKWKPLGSGYEGETFIYDNAVVKTFTMRSPLRNCVPDTNPSLRWPTEIPASLLLGNVSMVAEDENADALGFVSIKDYFLAGAGSSAQWHLVTPFFEAGNLEKSAGRLRAEGVNYRDLDARFRPSFNRLLTALDRMHTSQNLCHDDIKPDNIFVSFSDESYEADTHWVFADLGNARQPSHPYHSSRLWSTANGQRPDCRVNDVVRLAKSYVLFLRQASARISKEEIPGLAPFDEAFFAGQEPWSRLYWSIIDDRLLTSTAAAAKFAFTGAARDDRVKIPSRLWSRTFGSDLYGGSRQGIVQRDQRQ